MAPVSLVLLSLFGSLLARCDAFLDFCVPSSDTEKLTGQKSELCYIRDGGLNRYAEKFTWVIPAHVSTLNFYWDYRHPVFVASYELNVVYNPDPAIGKWSSSLQSHKGGIPRGLQKFNITLPCTGKAHGEIDLTIYLTIRAGTLDNHYDLQLKRKKICLNGSQDETFLAPKDGFLGSLFSAADNATRRDMTQGVNTKFLAIVGSVTVAFFIVIVAVALIVQKSKKKPSDLDMEANSHFGQLTSLNGQVASPEEDPRDPNGYYATSSVKDSLLRHAGQYYETSGRESAVHPPSSVYPSVLGTGRSMAHLNSQQLFLYETEVLTLLIENFKKNTYIEADPMRSEGRSSVHITQTIMEGTFGLLCRGVAHLTENGELTVTEVWIKTLKEGSVTDIQTRAMLEEALLLQQAVATGDHRNINAVRAFSLMRSEDLNKPDIPMLLYTAHGYQNLKMFLKLDATKAWTSLAKSVWISMEILQGLDFLHSQNPPVVHRDIGARNCLIAIGPDDSEMPSAQISDSALARDVFPSDYDCIGDNQNRPVKWLAKESLVDYVFTPASDIWSFGVLMWEITSLGETPYAEYDAADMEQVLANTLRLARPLNCPAELHQSMSRCWVLRPDERPTGKRLLAELRKFDQEYTNAL
ncbi:hypothetical protein RvY_18447 [Ramazzottius varieornatus]|uniref:Protein kinase domain-containing protein n=1 Tax=Ramazzottius varieornatus TaxID=947166 RepID=A0A1D1W681_RAMVA|nr:hypothetical protein RvY_18447 [Ramazzottius varieornatus]